MTKQKQVRIVETRIGLENNSTLFSMRHKCAIILMTTGSRFPVEWLVFVVFLFNLIDLNTESVKTLFKHYLNMGFDCLTAAIDKKLDSLYFRIRWVSALIEHGRQQERKKGNTEGAPRGWRIDK